MEQVSAFSIYGTKNRNTQQLLSKKKKRNSQKASNQKSKKQKNVKQIKSENQQMQHKGTGVLFKAALLKRLFTNLNVTLYLLQER